MSTQLLSEYIKKSELAAELGISERTLERWQRLRKGPPVTKIGALIVYRRSSVIEWIAGQEVKSAPARKRGWSSK